MRKKNLAIHNGKKEKKKTHLKDKPIKTRKKQKQSEMNSLSKIPKPKKKQKQNTKKSIFKKINNKAK